MAQALGVRLLDAEGEELGRGGIEFARFANIDLSGRDPRLDGVQIDVACNWRNLLCGERGVARVFGPQKGASPEQVERLAGALDNFADVIERDLGVDVREAARCGASGGLGARLSALLGATLHPRYDVVSRYLEVESLIEGSDLVFTAEGGINFQTPRGKIPAEIAGRARKFGVPVVAIVSTAGKGAGINHDYGIDAYLSILQEPCTLEDAIVVGSIAEGTSEALLAGKPPCSARWRIVSSFGAM
jgi:glycerate kinase